MFELLTRTLVVCLLTAHAAAGQYATGQSFINRNIPGARLAQIPEARPKPNLYHWSLAALAAANVADVATTWGRPELNPALGGTPRFGLVSLVAKSALCGGSFLLQRKLIHSHPGSRRSFTWVNFVMAGGLGGVAVHNQSRGAPR